MAANSAICTGFGGLVHGSPLASIDSEATEDKTRLSSENCVCILSGNPGADVHFCAAVVDSRTICYIVYDFLFFYHILKASSAIHVAKIL